MNEDTSITYEPLRPFARLIGGWDLHHHGLNTKEEWTGHDTFAWLPGKHFLTLRHHEDGDEGIDGITVIGNETGWDETEPSKEIVGHWFESSSGHHYKYIWELEGDRVQFWLTSKQSGIFFKGEFSEDNNTISGTWKWPGGGYDLVMRRVS
jgi:hypothetical protein